MCNLVYKSKYDQATAAFVNLNPVAAKMPKNHVYKAPFGCEIWDDKDKKQSSFGPAWCPHSMNQLSLNLAFVIWSVIVSYSDIPFHDHNIWILANFPNRIRESRLKDR